MTGHIGDFFIGFDGDDLFMYHRFKIRGNELIKFGRIWPVEILSIIIVHNALVSVWFYIDGGNYTERWRVFNRVVRARNIWILPSGMGSYNREFNLGRWFIGILLAWRVIRSFFYATYRIEAIRELFLVLVLTKLGLCLLTFVFFSWRVHILHLFF